MRRLSAAAVLLAVLASGCGTSGAGVAARVGRTRIRTATLAGYVASGYVDKQFTASRSQADVQRDWLNRLVRAQLVREAARRLHVTVTDADVAARRAQFEQDAGGPQALAQQALGGGFGPAGLAEAIRTFTLQDAVADALVADVPVTDAQLRDAYRRNLGQFDVAHIAHVLAKNEATALVVLAKARAGTAFAALAKQYSQDPDTAQAGGDLGEIRNGDGKYDPAFEHAVFTARTGDVVGPIKGPGGYEVVKVIERRTRSFEAARADLRRAVVGTRRDQRLAAYLVALAKDLGVHVNPRFGAWDGKAAQVANADTDILSTPAPAAN